MTKSNKESGGKTPRKLTNKSADFTHGSDNVFADLGFEPEAATNLLTRSQLAIQIENAIKDRGWNQTQAANFLDVSQPRISELMTGQIGKFTIDTLIGYLDKLEIAVTISSFSVNSDFESETQWDSLISQGVECLNTRKLDCAEEALRTSLAVAQKMHNAELIADSNYLLAGVFVTQMRLSEAVPFLIEAVSNYKLTDETRKLFRTFQALGMVFASQNELPKAQDSFEEANLLGEELPIGSVNLESNFIWLAAIAEKQKHLHETEKYLRRLLALQKQRLGPKSSELATTYKLLERIFEQQGRSDEARMISAAVKKLKTRLEPSCFSVSTAMPYGFPAWSKTALEQTFVFGQQ